MQCKTPVKWQSLEQVSAQHNKVSLKYLFHLCGDRIRLDCMQWHNLAWPADSPSPTILPRTRCCRRRDASTAMPLQRTPLREALFTVCAPQPHVMCMHSLVFAQVLLSSKQAATRLASVRLHSGMCNDVCFQLIRPIELFCAACNEQFQQMTTTTSLRTTQVILFPVTFSYAFFNSVPEGNVGALTAQGFIMGQVHFLSSNQQHQSTEGNTKALTQPVMASIIFSSSIKPKFHGSSFLVGYKKVMCVHEDAMRKLLPWNLGFTRLMGGSTAPFIQAVQLQNITKIRTSYLQGKVLKYTCKFVGKLRFSHQLLTSCTVHTVFDNIRQQEKDPACKNKKCSLFGDTAYVENQSTHTHKWQFRWASIIKQVTGSCRRWQIIHC